MKMPQNEIYKNIFEKSTDGMLIIQNDKFVDCNNSVVKMLHYANKKQLLNTHPSELSPEYQADGRKSYDRVEENAKIVLEKGSHTFEWIHLRSNGEPFWVEVVLTDMSTEIDVIFLVVWREIGEKKLLEEKNSYQQMLLNSVLNSSIDLIYYKDYKNEDGAYIGCNDSFERFAGKTKEDITGKNDIELFGEELGLFCRSKDKDVMDTNDTISNEEWVTYPNGDKVLLHTTKSLLKYNNNEVIGILGISRDMTNEYKYKKQLEENIEQQKQLSALDPLTEIYNRRSFFEISEKLLKISNRNHSPLTLMMIDIDLFKRVNDRYGHLVGDDILKYVTSTIQSRLRKSDIFGRYGGEEFLVLLPNTDLQGGLELAEEIRSLFSNTPYIDEKLSLRITVSIGVTQHTDETLMRQFIEKSDSALYAAKRNGRNRIEQFKKDEF